jgi:NSS family neurotransmitter:Na+ symporter
LLAEMSAGSTNGKRFFALWLLLLRYLAPIAISIVFLDVLGVI